MNFILARLGQWESRRVVRTIWKRRRGDGQMVGSECETRKPTWTSSSSQQRRDYSDDALQWPGQHILQHEAGREEERKSAWGLSRESTGRNRQKEAARHARNAVEEGNNRGGTALRADTNSLVDSLKPNGSEQVKAARNDSVDVDSQVSLWERFENDSTQTAGTQPQDQVEIDDGGREYSIPADSLLELDYRKELPIALSRRAPDLVIRCLFAAAQVHDMDYIGSISARMFSQILQLLEPTQFVVELGIAHIELSSALTESMSIAPMREVAFEYNKTLLRVLKTRRMTRHLPTLEDYTLLLSSARLLGSHKMASIVWRSLLKDGLHPNTQCFNYYMASLVWNGVHSAGSRQKVRVRPFHMMARSAAHQDRRYMNYRVGAGGIKDDTMRAFGEMLAFGAVANHESFVILVTACARDGDIDTVKVILQRVWGINVQGIMDGKDEASIIPKSFSEHSPIRPRSSLLFAVAHAFGINNDVPSALRVVDFVARHYELEITADTWGQLFEWTFVLASQRQPTSSEMGKLPVASVTSLWDTMTGAPYHINPTVGMYSRLISHLVDRKWTSKIMELMRKASPLLRTSRNAARDARHRLEASIKKGRTDECIEIVRQEWENAELICTRNLFWARRWVQQLLTSLNIRNVFDGGKAKFLHELPRFLWEWRRHAPRTIRYETASGFVELEFYARRDMERQAGAASKIAERRLDLREKSRRYVGNDWAIGYKMPERNTEQRQERKWRKAVTLAEKRSRALVNGHLMKEFGGIL